MSKKKHTHKQTAHQPQPQWQPIEMLEAFGPHIDGMLASSQEQYETLLPARSKPHVLNNYTTDRVISVFTEQIGDLWLFDTQLQRWAAEQISTEQRAEVERLQGQMKMLRETDEQVLALAKELSKGTIEKIMAKSDEQLGLEMLMRMMERK
jgi:hypothetical protein